MKFHIFLILLCFFYTADIFSQSDKPESAYDSLTYFDTVKAEVAPVCLNISEVIKIIKYPPEAVKDSAEGRVIVKCLVGKDGNVEKTGKISGPEIFFPEVKRVAMFLKFTPGLVNNYPVKVWVTVPFNFKLK